MLIKLSKKGWKTVALDKTIVELIEKYNLHFISFQYWNFHYTVAATYTDDPQMALS
jgi:hypothetical protein